MMADVAATPDGLAGVRDRPAIGVTMPNLAVATLGAIAFAVVYFLVLWIYAVALLPAALAVALIASRVWTAARRRGTYFLLNPFRAEHRLHVWQAGSRLLLWVLVAFLSLPTLGALQYLVSGSTAAALRAVFWLSVAALLVVAFVPHRRIFVPTNILVAWVLGFMALQAVRLELPARSAVTIDMPFAGEWYVFSGGRSALVNNHWTTVPQRDALDIIQIRNGSSYRGDKNELTSYYAYGKPVVAPAPGRITALTDSRPNVAIGDSDRAHPEGNFLILEIGGGRYVMMGHLQPGSAKVGVGDTVRRGQPLANVGNSGNTSEPHLHIQVQNTADFQNTLGEQRTYPVLFSNTVLIRGGDAGSAGTSDPRRNDFIRNAAHGR
jgi:hypothetical protein